MDIMVEDAYALERRQQDENTAFRRTSFQGLFDLLGAKWRVDQNDRAAVARADRDITEYRLEQHRSWVALFERHLAEIEGGHEALVNPNYVEGIRRGLAYRRGEIRTLEGSLS